MKRLQRGFTLVEIMIVVAIIALLAAIAIPNVLRGRATANESAAIGNVHALVSSLEMFRAATNVYPDDWLGDMVTNATPDYAPASFAGANLNLQTGTPALQGFNYDYNPASGTTPATYNMTAVPSTLNSGSRSFFADDTGVVRHCSCPASGNCTAATVNANTLDAPPNTC